MAEFYYYVKSGGLAIGDAGRSATKRTGSFAAMGASTYYDSIYDVFTGAVPTTTPVAGDFVLCASDHDKTYAAATVIGIKSKVTVISVDTANAENYLSGAWERTTTAVDLTLFDTLSAPSYMGTYGMSFECADDMFLRLNRREIYMYGGEIKSNTKDILLNFDGMLTVFHKMRINIVDINDGILTAAASVRLDDCVWVVNNNFLFFAGGTGGGEIVIENSDLSVCTGALIEGTTINHDFVNAKVNRTKIGTGFVGVSATDKYVLKDKGCIFNSCDTGDGYYFYTEEREFGTTTQDTAIYRTAGAQYDGTNGFSSEMVGNAGGEYNLPLYSYLGSMVVDTADFTTDVTFKVHFAVDGSTTALNSDEFWIEVEYVDGADNALGVIATTRADPLATGTAPTTETSLWTGLGGTNKQMSISTTATIGTTAGTITNGVVRVKAYLGKASQTVFVCPQVEVS